MSKPEVKYRIGSVVAAVWRNKPDGKKPFHTVKLQRSYRDGDDTKYTDSFSLGDLPNLQRVLAKAQEYVEEQDLQFSSD